MYSLVPDCYLVELFHAAILKGLACHISQINMVSNSCVTVANENY